MKAERSHRRFFNRIRKKRAGKNGVIPSGALDIPWLEIESQKTWKRMIRRKAEMQRRYRERRLR